MRKSIFRRTLALSLGTLLFSGCGGGTGGSASAPSTAPTLVSEAPLTPGGDAADSPDGGVSAGLGRLEISIPLLNARAVKADIASFKITLSQNGREFRTQEFSRAEVEALGQTVVFENVPAGPYEVTILYLSTTGTELGRYTQTLTVGDSQVATIDNPGYENSKPDFKTLRFLAEGYYPNFHDTGDFNGDGILDLVYCDNISSAARPEGHIYVRIGVGDGYFEPYLRLTTPVRDLQYPAVGDLNKDGRQDIAVAGEDSVSVFLGNGDGTFEEAFLLALGSDSLPWGLKIADLDNDKNPDLVTTNSRSNTVSVIYGNGDGTFEDPDIYEVGIEPGDLIVVDIDKDDQLDIVVANYEAGSLSFLYGQTGRELTRGADTAVASKLWEVDAGDVNGDDFPDLACTSADQNTVFLFLSDGSGDFLPPVSRQVGESPTTVKFTDVDEDGILDLFVANYTSEDFSIFHGTTAGNFGPESRLETFGGAWSARLDDINGDSHLDIVSCQVGEGCVVLSLGGGDGTFETVPPRYEIGSFPIDLERADLNGDGNADLVTANLLGNTVSVALGDGTGDFRISELTGITQPRTLVVDDLNLDGQVDIVVGSLTGIHIFTGKGDGTFDEPVQQSVAGKVHRLTGADVNSDGFLDLVVADFSTDLIQILMGQGDGTFEFLTSTQSTVSGFAVVVSDFNKDGDLDLAALSNTETVSVMLNNGDDTFSDPALIPVPDENGGTTEVNLTTGDMNGDGNVDLLVTHHLEGNVAIVPGNGDGTFGDFFEIDLGDGASEILVQDVNGDSIPDILSSFEGFVSARRPGVAVRTGNGDGTFQNTINFITGSLNSALVAGDFNNDGGTDLAVADLSGHLTILLAR